MSRGLSTAFKNHIQGDVIRPAYFCRMEFLDETLRLWSGNGSIVFDSQTYTGVGAYGGISNTEETWQTIASGVTLSLAGQGTGIYQAAMADSRQLQGRPCYLWVAFMNQDFDNVLYSYQLGKYLMDKMEIVDVIGDSQSGGIRINLYLESELVDMFDSSPVYYSDSDQKALHPDDTFFRYIATLPGKEIPWGEKINKGSTGSSSGTHHRWSLRMQP